jgi:arsenate reductase
MLEIGHEPCIKFAADTYVWTAMGDRITNVLFLCTQNSARSVMAECILNKLGADRFRAFSAGSHPAGRVNPDAIELLARLAHPTGGLRSKSWDVFAVTGAPEMDVVITVCDHVAGEACPLWPGRPVTAHWSFPDPAAVRGNAAERNAAFAAVYRGIEARVKDLVALPPDAFDSPSLGERLAEPGPGRP